MLQTTNERLYADYVIEHIQNVAFAFYNFLNNNSIYKLLEPFTNKIDFNNIERRIILHDRSKWAVEEFNAYRQYFYPEVNESKNESIFNEAWIHHFSINDHHPEYWIIEYNHHLDEIINENFSNLQSYDMSIEAIIEMFADWLAMSLKLKTSLIEWYNKEGYKYPYSDRTRKLIDVLILPLEDKLIDELAKRKYLEQELSK